MSPVRAGAALAMLVAAAATYGVAASPAFEASDVELAGLRYTDEAAVRSRLELPEGTNLFALATEPLERALLELPTVASASITVRLPETLAVEIVEREPILVWQVGERGFLADVDGALFAELGASPSEDARSLPRVDDRREASGSLELGARLDPVDLDAARRLGSLRPSDLGSAAVGLSLALTDTNGFVMGAAPGSPAAWRAVFGFYTPSVRTPEIIPGQVRLLRSLLLKQGERNVERIVLASETDGTFTTPKPSVAP